MIFSPALKETSPSNSTEKATSVKRKHSSFVKKLKSSFFACVSFGGELNFGEQLVFYFWMTIVNTQIRKTQMTMEKVRLSVSSVPKKLVYLTNFRHSLKTKNIEYTRQNVHIQND